MTARPSETSSELNTFWSPGSPSLTSPSTLQLLRILFTIPPFLLFLLVQIEGGFESQIVYMTMWSSTLSWVTPLLSLLLTDDTKRTSLRKLLHSSSST